MSEMLETPVPIMARQAHVSERFSGRLFRDELQTTPRRQCLRPPLSRARELLRFDVEPDGVALRRNFANAATPDRSLRGNFGTELGNRLIGADRRRRIGSGRS